MKSNIKILAVLFTLVISSVLFPKGAEAQQAYVSFQVFYDQLSPYGKWVDYPSYGYVWIPDAGPDFFPYSSAGHWILTEYGWTWVSDYDWGWAPFHYGRWAYDSYYGWLWVPDNEWGPSWVTWRRAEGYYGWEPMGPGISVTVSFGREYNRYQDHWVFVRERDFERPDIQRYYVNRTDHDRIIRNSRVINKTYVDNRRHATYVSGPDRAEVQKVTGRRVSTVAIQENNKPGQDLNDGKLLIYRPDVRRNSDKEQKAVPSRVTNLKDVKRLPERNATNPPRNANPADNNGKERQPNTVNPQNSNNNKVQPSQPQKTTPPDNSRKERQPNTVNPQNENNSKAQPRQQQNANPSQNNRREQQQQNSAKPSDNNRNGQQNDSKSGEDKRRKD
jgi:hypothetical protein